MLDQGSSVEPNMVNNHCKIHSAHKVEYKDTGGIRSDQLTISSSSPPGKLVFPSSQKKTV